MLNFLKKFFRKAPPQPVAPRVVARAATAPNQMDQGAPRPQVEVAHLSLAAILQKFPEDLKSNVASIPAANVTVALPLATIHKQLPSGSVKMSLASLYRQAPAGVFAGPSRAGDKRMVEVPLSEIFRHVKPQALRRRSDQRKVDLPSDSYELFSDKENPYTVAPGVAEPAEEPEPEMVPDGGGRGIRPSEDLRMGGGRPEVSPFVASPPPGVRTAPAKAAAAPPTSGGAPKNGHGASEGPSISLALADLCNNWAEPIRSEALAMEGAQVLLPASAVAVGMAKGKVTFSWGQIRGWLEPAPEAPTQGREATELVLPLKVVAPAFMASQGGRANSQRKKVALDESIPALFSGGEAASRKAEPIPLPDPTPEPPPASSSIPAPRTLAAPDFAAAPAPEPEPEAGIEPEAPAPTIIPFPTAESTASGPAPAPAPAVPTRAPQTVGELLGKPDKDYWSPQELVKAASGLPGVSGAVVGLDEGLLVAAELPSEVKGDTVAAFLPQMFARLNNYTGEMKLGEVDELLFTTHNAHFQAYKLGEVYFGVLGKPGEALPWDSLRVVTAELGRQTTK